MGAVIQCRDLNVEIGDRLLLSEINLDVDRSQSVAIMGRSGSGKTTLLHALSGLHSLTPGSLIVAGKDVGRLSSKERSYFRLHSIGLVLQFGELLPELTVAENVGLQLALQGKANPGRVNELLDAVALSEHANSFPGRLSGGELQRAAIARAVAARPPVLLADEPTGALDEDLAHLIVRLLITTARAEHAALVLVTHDPEIAAYADIQFKIRGKRLVPL